MDKLENSLQNENLDQDCFVILCKIIGMFKINAYLFLVLVNGLKFLYGSSRTNWIERNFSIQRISF